MNAEGRDGYRILTYLRGKKTADVSCNNRMEAEQLLFSLTSPDRIGLISTSDSVRIEPSKMNYDVAEMWKNGEMVALGLKPSQETKLP